MMASHRAVALFAVLFLLGACGGDETDGGGGAATQEDEGSISFRVDGATVDLVEGESSSDLQGSTLFVSLVQQRDDGASFQRVLEIKAFDGEGTYAIDGDGVTGRVAYDGNDGNSYASNNGDDPSSGCTVEVTEATDARVAGTFTCTALAAAINDPDTGGCCAYLTVDVTEGEFSSPLE